MWFGGGLGVVWWWFRVAWWWLRVARWWFGGGLGWFGVVKCGLVVV